MKKIKYTGTKKKFDLKLFKMKFELLIIVIAFVLSGIYLKKKGY